MTIGLCMRDWALWTQCAAPSRRQWLMKCASEAGAERFDRAAGAAQPLRPSRKRWAGAGARRSWIAAHPGPDGWEAAPLGAMLVAGAIGRFKELAPWGGPGDKTNRKSARPLYTDELNE